MDPKTRFLAPLENDKLTLFSPGGGEDFDGELSRTDEGEGGLATPWSELKFEQESFPVP